MLARPQIEYDGIARRNQARGGAFKKWPQNGHGFQFGAEIPEKAGIGLLRFQIAFKNAMKGLAGIAIIGLG